MGGRAPAAGWACYHTEMDVTEHEGITVGVVGLAVGAPFAVLVAEQLFASGCRLLISVTSAGQIVPVGPTPYFVLIDRALRDEGTSHHYLPPSMFAEADAALADRRSPALAHCAVPVHRGTAWTTDAPYRETEDAIAAARAHGALAVEMEAAALYAFAQARRRDVLCFAHVTNRMARVEGDFEKGEADGARDFARRHRCGGTCLWCRVTVSEASPPQTGLTHCPAVSQKLWRLRAKRPMAACCASSSAPSASATTYHPVFRRGRCGSCRDVACLAAGCRTATSRSPGRPIGSSHARVR